MSYALHPSAEAELDEIIAFIARDSTAAAMRVLRDFEETFGLLATQPAMGHRRPELASKPLRFWTLHRFVIAYDPDAVPLLVVMVIHGVRNPRTIASILASR